MSERGRRKVIDQRVRDLIVTLVRTGFTLKQAAEHARIGQSTLFDNLKQDSAFAKEIRDAQVYQHLFPLSRMLEHSKTSWRAAAWILERTKPDRYGRRAPRTLTQADFRMVMELVLRSAMEGVQNAEDRARVVHNVERMVGQLDEASDTSPRVRRALRDVKQAAGTRKGSDPPRSDASDAFPGAGDYRKSGKSNDGCEKRPASRRNRHLTGARPHVSLRPKNGYRLSAVSFRPLQSG